MKIKLITGFLAIAFMVAMLATLPLMAQVNTAEINGTIFDTSGAVVPNANIIVSNKETGFKRSTVSNETGAYSVSQIPPGTYSVRVEASGFATLEQKNVTVLVGQQVPLKMTLKAGSATEVVEVTSEPPLVELTRSEIAGSVSPLETKELPIVDRNFAGLAMVIPGVRPAEGFDPTKARAGNFSIGGGDGRQVDINIDGADNKDNVVGGLVQNYTIEGIQEFNVVTNRYSAESGRSVGAVVNVVTKSGTNTIHGSAFGFFQNSGLNAKGFFDTTKPKFHRYQFGGSAGGALIKDKLFAFGAYEHKREPGNISVEPTAFGELSLVPLATPIQQLPASYKDHLLTVKLDYRMNDRNSFSIRYGRERLVSPNDQLGNPFTTDATETNSDTNQFHDLNIQHNLVVSPNKVNTINVHFQDFVNTILGAPSRTFTLNVAGGGTATNPHIIFPSADIGTNTNVPQATFIRKYQFRDDFSWTVNRHTLKFGTNYIYEPKLGGFFFFGANGYELTFLDDPSTIAACPALSATCTRAYPNGLATPGALSELTFSGGDGNFNQKTHQLAFYFQDDYKITSRLTLNLGVRWDVNKDFLPNQTNNRTINLLQTVTNVLGGPAPVPVGAADGLARAQEITGNASLLRRTTASYKEFQPRVGFAWDVTGTGKHVIRGGYGIARDQVFQNLTLFSLQQTNPTIYQTILDQTNPAGSACTPGPSNPLCSFRFGVDALPAAPAGIGTIADGAFGRINDPRMKDPMSQQTSIGWSWQIAPDYALSVDYIHSLGLYEPRVLNINPKIADVCDPAYPGANPADPRCVRGTSTRFFDAAFAAAGLGAGRLEQINKIGTNNRSRFDTLNIQLKKRMSRNFMLQTSYVLSRSRSWGGRPTASYSGNGVAITPELQFAKGEFGPTIFDERHRFVISGVVQLPYGFEAAPIFQAASARPFNFRAGTDINGDGRSTLDRVCVGSTVTNVLPSVKGCEQVSINALRGDPLVQLDVRLGKHFKFGERAKLNFYWEFFNLFNTDNFGNNFGTNSNASSFNTPLGYFGGQGFGPASSGPFRSQYGLRFEF